MGKHGYVMVDGSNQCPSPSQLATGVADSTTYLRGDGTWATPPGGGSPSDTVADLDGSGAGGSSENYSRGDHKHADANRPTTGQKAALAGTNGTPGAGNPYVTDTDSRMVNARAPTAHASSHADGGSDEITAALDARAYPLVADIVANRPAAGVSGRCFWSTDEGILYRDNGTSWDKAAINDLADGDGAITSGQHPTITSGDLHTEYQQESEKGATNGYASLDGNTRVPTGQLGSGTADSTVFLRGDSSWAAPPSGPATVKKTADQTYNNSTPADVTSLAFSVTNGVYYHFKFIVLHQSPTATVGLKFGLTFPGVTRFGAVVQTVIAAAGVDSTLQGPITATGGSVTGTAVPATNTDYVSIIEGVILPSANGTLQVQASNETGTTVVTVRQGSCGILTTL